MNIQRVLAFLVGTLCAGMFSTLASSGKDAQNDAAASASANMAPCIQWTNPLGKPRFALLCIHGLGLYSKSYENFGKRISRHGAAVYAIDVRGFGSWMQAQGKAQLDFKGCLQDIKTALDSIHAAQPGLPVFLLGESMGGAIALRAASMYPESIDGLISSVPAGDRFQNKRADLKVALHMLKGPNKQFDIGSKVIQQASTNVVLDGDKKVNKVDEKEVHDWESDPLDRMDLSAKELLQFQIFMDENYDCAKKVDKLPVLFIQGIDDRLVKPNGTWDLFKTLATENRTMLALPSRHLIFEESQDTKHDVNVESTTMLLAWINSQMGFPGVTSANSTGSGAINPALDHAIQQLNNGNLLNAQEELERCVKEQPDSAEAHYWLGISLIKAKRPMLARKEFVLALQAQKDADHRQEANNYLLSLDTAPENTTDSAEITGTTPENRVKRITQQAPATEIGRDIAHGKPSVLLFFADWCQQCAQMDKIITQGTQMFGERIQFRKIDVADQANKDIIKNFSVGPIPTIVFLDKNGAVTSTLIGESNFVHVAKEVAGIVR